MRNYKSILLFSLGTFLLLFIIVYCLVAWYVAQRAGKDTTTKADAILVLGARSYINGKYNPCLVARVDHAVALYTSGFAPKLFMSGGLDKEDHVSEADIMKKIAVAQGIPADVILEERASTSTFENFSFSSLLLKEQNIHSVIVVTEPFHAARAALVAKKLGYTFSMSPAKDSPCWQEHRYFSKYFLKEPFALMWYWLRNRL